MRLGVYDFCSRIGVSIRAKECVIQNASFILCDTKAAFDVYFGQDRFDYWSTIGSIMQTLPAKDVKHLFLDDDRRGTISGSLKTLLGNKSFESLERIVAFGEECAIDLVPALLVSYEQGLLGRANPQACLNTLTICDCPRPFGSRRSEECETFTHELQQLIRAIYERTGPQLKLIIRNGDQKSREKIVKMVRLVGWLTWDDTFVRDSED